jgi:hypothetical protein
MHFNNSVCPVKLVNADQVENLVIGKRAELSQNEATVRTSVDEAQGRALGTGSETNSKSGNL